MNTQLKASFKKEIMAFVRTKRFIILLCVFIGLSMFDPIMIKGMSTIMNSISGSSADMGIDFSAITEEMADLVASGGVASSISELTGTGLLIFLLLINGFAGGEQKKRSIILPKTSGLRNSSYLFPKYKVYPAAVFVFSILGILASTWVSSVLFDINDISVPRVLLAGALAGVYLMMYVCFHLTLGTATGQAGMSSAVCIVAAMILPNIFSIPGMYNAYNPFSLNLLAVNVLHGELDAGEIIPTVIITLAIMLAVYLIALFAQNAKQIDNTGNETVI